MTKRKILIAMTGSVGTVLAKKIVAEHVNAGFEVAVILTEHTDCFISDEQLSEIHSLTSGHVYRDSDEWPELWKKDDPVLHIQLRDEYEALVIAPASANTIAKIANGICDNLLTSVARAWLWYKPVIIAPAMNTEMYIHPITQEHIVKIKGFPYQMTYIKPVIKVLACGQKGIGGLADIGDIVAATKNTLRWLKPLNTKVIPVTPHPGAFGFDRKGSRHTGIDLYTNEHSEVRAMESGVVVSIEHFTGEWDNSPWWKNTDCVMIRGASGVIVYGEIKPAFDMFVGKHVTFGDPIGTVARVIKEGREHPEITGWNHSMLHVELYPWDRIEASHGFEDFIIDPTSRILEAFKNTDTKTVTYDKYIA